MDANGFEKKAKSQVSKVGGEADGAQMEIGVDGELGGLKVAQM
jgi:hypothetical protein